MSEFQSPDFVHCLPDEFLFHSGAGSYAVSKGLVVEAVIHICDWCGKDYGWLVMGGNSIPCNDCWRNRKKGLSL